MTAPDRPTGHAATTDDGLRFLASGAVAAAHETWHRLIAANVDEPEPFLFESELCRAEQRWSKYAEMVKLSERACALDSNWAEAWLSIGEWHSTTALQEGQRRTGGSTQKFRLDDILKERGTFDRTVECYARAAELDDGRLRGEIALTVSRFWDLRARLDILGRAGERARWSALDRSPVDLLRRAGIDDRAIESTPANHELFARIKSVAVTGCLPVVVASAVRYVELALAFEKADISCSAAGGFRSADEREEWFAGAVASDVLLLSPWAAAVGDRTWQRAGSPARVKVLWVGAESLSIAQLLGGMRSTSPMTAVSAGFDQTWFVAKLLSRSPGSNESAVPTEGGDGDTITVPS